MTAKDFIPRAGGWLDLFLKTAAVLLLGLALARFALGNEDVQNDLAEAVGVPEVKATAEAALALAQNQAATIATFQQDVRDVAGAIATAQTQIASTTTSLAAVATKLDDTTAKLLELDARQIRSSEAPMQIIDPGRIEQVPLGGRTRVTIRFAQNKDCGRADHWSIRFRDSAGLSGAFQDLSVNDSSGFGPRFDVAEESFRDYTFTAVLPGDDLFSPGVAQGRVIVSGWQLCPDAEEARSPSIAFTILPPDPPKRK